VLTEIRSIQMKNT
jgi:cell envelope-related function transcriptional attenuator common domain